MNKSIQIIISDKYINDIVTCAKEIVQTSEIEESTSEQLLEIISKYPFAYTVEQQIDKLKNDKEFQKLIFDSITCQLRQQ